MKRIYKISGQSSLRFYKISHLQRALEALQNAGDLAGVEVEVYRTETKVRQGKPLGEEPTNTFAAEAVLEGKHVRIE